MLEDGVDQRSADPRPGVSAWIVTTSMPSARSAYVSSPARWPPSDTTKPGGHGGVDELAEPGHPVAPQPRSRVARAHGRSAGVSGRTGGKVT